MVKNLPAMQKAWVRSLGQEDPLGKGMATHSSTLAWRIPWTEEPGGLQSMGLQRLGHDCATNTFGFTSGSDSKESACKAGDLGSIPGSGRSPEEGNGNPLQYSCLENPMAGYSPWSHRGGHNRASNTHLCFYIKKDRELKNIKGQSSQYT